jgi:uncharacterized protein (TIGR03435 family)
LFSLAQITPGLSASQQYLRGTIGQAKTACQSSIANAGEARFEVVSIKRNTSERAGSNIVLRPNGGLTMLNVATITLLARAFEPTIPREMIGLPGWASNEHYDIRATSSLAHATPAQRATMLRSMLADRFKLLTHVRRAPYLCLGLAGVAR